MNIFITSPIRGFVIKIGFSQDLYNSRIFKLLLVWPQKLALKCYSWKKKTVTQYTGENNAFKGRQW